MRRGLTLLEILLSLALLLGALAALSQLITTGSEAAVQSQLRTQAILRCESKLGEVVAGVVPMQALDGAPFEDTLDWSWSLLVLPGPHTDLLQLEVTAAHYSGRASYSLTRLIRDPQLLLDAALLDQTTETQP